MLVAAVALAVLPLAADTRFRAALAAQAAGNREQALQDVAVARLLAPGEAIYAAEAGDVLLDVDRTGAPGADADPAAASVAYRDAIRLGDARPSVRRRLAEAERLAHA